MKDRISQNVERENELLKKTLAELGHKNASLEEKVLRLAANAFIDEESATYTEEYFHHRLGEEVHRAERYRQFLTLLLLDVEDYPEQLPLLVGNLKTSLRQIDILSRLRNNQIAVALLETAGSDSEVVVRRLRETIQHSDRIRFSTASYPTDADRHRSLFEVAQIRLRKVAESST